MVANSHKRSHRAANGCKRLQTIANIFTNSRKWSQTVQLKGSKQSKIVANNLKRLQMIQNCRKRSTVTNGGKWLQIVAKGCKLWQMVETATNGRNGSKGWKTFRNAQRSKMIANVAKFTKVANGVKKV